MYKLKGNPKTVRVTQKLAAEFATMEPAPHDRPLSERRLQIYGRVLEAGGFRPCTWARAHCKETGAVYRVNGKHTSTLFSGLEKLPELYVVIEDYLCDTLHDVARLYGTFDTRAQARTTNEINASFAGAIPELAGIEARIISYCVTGLCFHKWQEQYSQKPAVERAEELIENADFVLWVAAILKDKNAQHLRRGTVVGAMFATYQKNSEAAGQFWMAVRDETAPVRTAPDRVLAHWLLTNAVSHGPGAKAGRRSASQREFYVRSIHAWNAWREGRTTDLKFYKDAKIPTPS